MECNALDLHRNFIENQKQQIEFANNLIEHANGNEEVIRMANELIKSCEKSISIEQNMYGGDDGFFRFLKMDVPIYKKKT